MILSQTEIDNLLTDLSSNDAEKRDKAERFYNENKAEILPLLLPRFENNREGLRTVQRSMLIAFVGIYLAVFMILMKVFTDVYGKIPFLIGQLCFYLPPLAGLLPQFFLRRCQPTPKEGVLIRLMEDAQDPRYLSYFLERVRVKNPYYRSLAEPILYRQLKNINESHEGLLAQRQLRYLQQQLIIFASKTETTFDEDKALAILSALTHIGTVFTMHSVAIVVRDTASEKIRDAAALCMQTISKRICQEEPRNTLLRASVNSGGQEELLRAANSQSDTHAETLLRVPPEE